MDSKQLTAIIALIAVAGIACAGVAYAFSASLDNEDNSASVQYWKLSVTDSSNPAFVPSTATAYKEAFTASTPYDTMTVWDDTAEAEELVMIWSGTTVAAGAKLSPLGYVKVVAKDDSGDLIPAVSGNEHYMMSLSMTTKDSTGEGTVNDTYDYYAGIVIPETDEGKEHTIKTHATQLSLFEKSTKNGFTTYTAQIPVQDLYDGTAVAIYAMPHYLEDIDSVTGQYLQESGDLHQTDVLQNAVVTFSVSSTLFDSASAYTAGSAKLQTPDTTADEKYRYTYDPTVGQWDLGNVVVVGEYQDVVEDTVGGVVKQVTVISKRVMAFTTETPYGKDVDKIVLKITGTETKDLPAEDMA